MKQLLLIFTLVASLFANSFDQLKEAVTEDSIRLYNPGVTTALSIIPGGGQIATKHFTKGGIFLATELILGTSAFKYWEDYHDAFKPYYKQRNYYDSLNTAFLLIPDSSATEEDTINLVKARHQRDLFEFDIEEKRTDYINYSAWFAGVYIWNFVDAIGVSNQFQGNQNPDPRRAGALSAIPFTGAGQIYNGSWFKAGLVSVVEIGCMVSAINFQRLMKDAQDYEKELKQLPDSVYYKIPLEERQAWKNNHNNAKESRTMFMWYGIFFYLYGITDAIVDAHMHGFDRNFHITGGVDPIDKKMNFAFTGEFGKRK